MSRFDRFLVLAFALVNAVLYSSLLPLWEGFDEPWHYAYVQYLSVARRLPVLGTTRLSQEVWDSMLDSPASHVVARVWPEFQTFDRYFALSPAARAEERSRLETLPRARSQESAHTNYEAQQPPLYYLMLAGPDLLLSNASITVRVLWLRIFGAVVSVVIALFAAGSLFRTLEMPAPDRVLCLFCILACQMFWAVLSHIGNDALALALSVWFFAAGARFAKRPDTVAALTLALATALGLLAKAYFLPLAIFAACLVAYRLARVLPAFAAPIVLLAGPWYVRNLVLYHNFSGLLMTSDGATPGQAVSSLAHVDWGRTIPYMMRATLWTGNNSFTSFSVVTLDCLLVLLAAGLAMYAIHAVRHAPAVAEQAVVGGLVTYAAAVIYVVGNDVTLLHGASAGAAPWYTEVLLLPSLAIVFLGLGRTRGFGLPVMAAVTVLWAYICIVTYLVKLIPLYGGHNQGRNTLKETMVWYWSRHQELTSMLSTVSLAPPAMIYLETSAVVVLAIMLAARSIRLAGREKREW